jgi:hypothetical protein
VGEDPSPLAGPPITAAPGSSPPDDEALVVSGPGGGEGSAIDLRRRIEPVLDAFRTDVNKLVTRRVEDLDRRTAEIVGGACDDAAELLDGANRQREAVAALLRLAIHQSERLLTVTDAVLEVVRHDHRRAVEVHGAFDCLTGRTTSVATAGNGLGHTDAPAAPERAAPATGDIPM